MSTEQPGPEAAKHADAPGGWPAPEQLQLRRRLVPVLDRAQQRARALRRPVLASLSLGVDDRVALPSLSRSSDGSFWLFEKPDAGLSLWGAGEAASFADGGRERFRGVRERVARLFSEAVAESDGVDRSPICFAGFAFDATVSPGAGWRGFPGARAVVPRLLIRMQQGSTLTLSTLVAEDSDCQAEASLLAQEALAMLVPEAVGRQPPPCGGDVEAPPADRAAWSESVMSLTRAIEAGEVDKVVLARRVDYRREDGFDLDAALERLRKRYPACTLFAVGAGGARFLGATPELLVELRDGIVHADCLAGSAARGASQAEDEAIGQALLADDKERREHAFVRDFQLAALQPLCSGIEAAEEPVLRRVANVQHLHTPIAATPKPRRHVLDFVEALHPTPATAGVPVGRALCLIRREEGFDRGWYAGPVGWFDPAGNGEFVVALRSALVRGDTASLFAGCGIVAGSDPQREFEESRLKLQAMSWALGLAT